MCEGSVCDNVDRIDCLLSDDRKFQKHMKFHFS
jgi:hypothetical protein